MILHYERLKVQIILESQTKYVGGEGEYYLHAGSGQGRQHGQYQ